MSATAPREVVVAMDKFRGTLTAGAAVQAVAVACGAARPPARCTPIPLSDGGEGLLEVFGGANRHTRVTGPSGDPVEAGWRFDRGRAVIETAQAIGLQIAGGAERNDPVAATTTGVGELIEAALAAGARRILVGLGGSATTDGGFGALRAVGSPSRLRGVELVIACDVTTRFLDAARVFGPQKGARPAQVDLLTGRLQRVAQLYADQYGCPVTEVPGAGAAGGLAGGLMVLGGTLRSGFDLVAEELDLADRIAGAALVITGEGHLDRQSFAGKTVGGVWALGRAAGVPVVVICGDADPDALDDLDPQDRPQVVTLVGAVGEDRAYADAAAALTEVAAAVLRTR